MTAVQLQRLSNLGPLTDSRLSEEESEQEPLASACGFADAADDKPGWLLLIGAAGSGRTRLAAEMANRRIADGRPALYFVAADLLDRLRSAMNAPSGGDFSFALLFEHVRDAPFLLLDDLDCVSPTDWAKEKLFQLLNHRRNSGRRTVLVSEAADLASIGLQSFVNSDVERLELARASSGRFREFGGMSEPLLRRFTFHNFLVNGGGIRENARNLQSVKAKVQQWADSPSGFLTLYGGTGVGKTHLASAAVAQQLDRGSSVCFAVVPELLDALRGSYRDEGEASFDTLFKWLKEVDFLVLDDLGAHQSTAWAAEKLYQLCSYRYLQMLPTVFTMNIQPDDLEPRLASRLTDQNRCTPVELIHTLIDNRTGIPAKAKTPKQPQRRKPAGLNYEGV